MSVSMSAVWFQLITFLCLLFGGPSGAVHIYGTARTGADVGGVVRKYAGESITIQCNSTPNQESLSLKKGLNEEHHVFYTASDSDKPTINSNFTGRLQYHVKFPKVEILIKNLSLTDTGPYWCVYKMIDKNFTPKTTRGSGSVLLVVTENRLPTVLECDQSQSDLAPMYVAICASAVIFVLTVSLIWIIHKKKHTTARTSRAENMSGRANSREDTL